MSTLTSTTVATRPTTLNNTTDVGKSYFETDSNKILVWDGANFNEWNRDGFALTFPTSTYSASFDGIDDRILIPDSSDLNTSGDITISFWFQRGRAGHNDFEGFISKASASNSVHYSIGFLPSTATPANTIRMWQGGAGANFTTTTTFTSTTDKVHACFVANGGNWYWYVNGSQDSTGTGWNTTDTGTDDLTLGALADPTPRKFYKGNLDEVFIWSRALSSTEVSNIYNNKTYPSTSLAAGWRLENDATDSINSNDGTNYGATLNSGGLY